MSNFKNNCAMHYAQLIWLLILLYVLDWSHRERDAHSNCSVGYP